MSNTLLNKYLLPYRFMSGVMLCIGIMSINLAQKESKLAKIIYQDDYYAHSDTNYFLCVLLIMISLGLSAYGFINIPKDANKRANELTKQYLKEIFVQYPELKQYEPVLSNPEKIREVAAFACNNLSKAEQKQILTIVKNTFDASEDAEHSDFEHEQNIRKAEDAILAIVKQHAEKDPTYIANILSLFANNHNIYVMSINNQKSKMMIDQRIR